MSKIKEKLKSYDIKQALEKKHDGDFFICEVKTGPSWYSKGLGIIDAWAMKKSWTKPHIVAYEVKVSRSDFVKDEKWMNYLQYCNSFYFVCPPNVIKKEELGADIGLIYVYPGTLHCRVIKKAPYRDIEIPEEIFRYILMNKIESDRYPFHSRKVDYWKAWVENKASNRDLAYQVRSKLLEHLRELESELENLRYEKGEYEKARKILKENGINQHNISWALEDIFNGKKAVGERAEVIAFINNIETQLVELRQRIKGDK